MAETTPSRNAIPICLYLLQIATETIPALEKLRKEGLVRAIGITGLPLDIYSYVLDK